LGSDCTKVLRESYEVVSLGSKDLDITRLSDVEKAIRHFLPDIVLNCAAFTQVDSCETEKELAWKVNAEGPENLAVSIEKYGGRLIHISTDYVFDGRKKQPEPYVEDDEPHPISFYGKSKLEGERAVRQITERHIIIRTAWLYGINGHNFLKTILKLSLKDSNTVIKVVNDQFGSPTWSYRLAVQLSKMIEIKEQGTYHATSEGYCTWYELACYFLKKIKIPHTVIPCSSDEYQTPASRPKNSVLENLHLKEKGINLMKDWQIDLDQYIVDYRDRLIEESCS